MVTKSYIDENDSRHCKDGFGGESFRTNLKIKSQATTIEKVENIAKSLNLK